MKIVALDSHPCDFDGLEWTPVSKLGEFTSHPRSTPEQVLERAKGADIVLVNKVVLNKSTLSSLSSLKCVCVTATGTNNVDLTAAAELGIAVCNVAGYSTESVAQHVFAFILEHFSRVAEYNIFVRNGRWVESPDFCVHGNPLQELAGKTLGIIGYGSIGKAVARIAEAFAMRVLLGSLPGRNYSEETARVPLEKLLEQSDILTLHCPLSPETENLINSKTLGLMKSSAILINTGRGGLVDETALANALEKRMIAHAFVDVLSTEPPSSENPLLNAINITISPHIAWASREARERLVNETAENIIAFQSGTIRNRVEPFTH